MSANAVMFNKKTEKTITTAYWTAALKAGFMEVMETRTGFSVRFIGDPVEGPAAMECERTVTTTAPVASCLVIRSQNKLAEYIHIKEGENKEQICNGLAMEIMRHLAQCMPEPGEQLAGKLSCSTPQNWPQKKPVAQAAALVEGIPVELRLWLL